MERIERARGRLRVAGIVLVIAGPILIACAWVHTAIARLSQIGLIDLVIAVSGVTAMCVGLEFFVARKNLVAAEKLHGLAQRRYIVLMVIAIAIVGSAIAGVIAYLIGATVVIGIGARNCVNGC